MNFPEIVYYINLEDRKDRREAIENEISKLNFKNIVRINAIKDDTGYIGCAKSHILAIEHFQASGYTNCLILEDDFYFYDHDKAKISLNEFDKIKNDIDWDIVFLSGRFFGEAVPTKCEYINKLNLRKFRTTSGYILNLKYTDILKNNINQAILLNRPLDVNWDKIAKIGNWMLFNPKLGNQRPGYSDIVKKYVDYRNGLK